MKTKQPRRTGKTLTKIAREKIRSSPKGVSAVFIPVTKNWAIKLFRDEEGRDNAYHMQKTYYGAGYAPELGDKIDLPEGIRDPITWGEFKYGYFTEIVKTVINKAANWNAMQDQRENFQQEWGDRDDPGSKLYSYIKEMWEEAGEELDDLHPGNWGYSKDGKLIPIDFGND
jgi:hypothetical protein